MSSPALMTAHLYVFGQTAEAATTQAPIAALIKRLSEHEVNAIVHAHDADPLAGISVTNPYVYVSIGGSDSDFPALFDMPLSERNRWMHFSAAGAVDAGAVLYCWLSATDPLRTPRELPPSSISATPLVSIFTAAYRSGDRLQRPYRSLLAQTYRRWEWVIMDDSGDDDATYQAHIRPLADPRIRKFRQDGRSGYIGTVKRAAAGLCTGEIILELDHDDDLAPDCLRRLVDAFRRHPECGFAFGEAAEVFEETMEPRWYGWDSGFGFLTYWRQYDAVTNRIQSVPRTANTNWKTIRHLLGLPNHPRAWTRDCYFAVGAHRVGLSVADDYDLLIRTFLCTRMLRVQHLLYVQYVNAGGANQTLQRNPQIQIMCTEVERYYRARIDARLEALGMPSLAGYGYCRIWTRTEDDLRWRAAEVLDVDEPGKTSHLFVIPHGDAQAVSARLLQVLQRCEEHRWVGLEIVVVGNVPDGLLEAAAKRAPVGAIRWWRTEASWPPGDSVRYGRMLCTGATREEHCAMAVDGAQMLPAARQQLALAEAFAPAAPEDRSRDRLSVLLHLRERFGYRRYLEIGCAGDEVFAQMNGFDLKVGIDPVSGGTHRLTSDAYFAANSLRTESIRDRFDLVFIAGQHDYWQVLRDVRSVLRYLQPGGTIVLHDAMPFEEIHQVMPRPRPPTFWTGDVWRAIFVLRQRADVDVAVGRFDWGVAVLRVRPNPRPFAALAGSASSWTWQDYRAHAQEGLNPLGYDDLLRWIDGQ